MSNMFTYLTPQFMDAVPWEEETYDVNMATLECILTHWGSTNFSFAKFKTLRVFSSWEKPTYALAFYCFLKYTILRVSTIGSCKFCQIYFEERGGREQEREKEKKRKEIKSYGLAAF